MPETAVSQLADQKARTAVVGLHNITTRLHKKCNKKVRASIRTHLIGQGRFVNIPKPQQDSSLLHITCKKDGFVANWIFNFKVNI